MDTVKNIADNEKGLEETFLLFMSNIFVVRAKDLLG